MQLVGKKPTFRRSKPRSNIYRILVILFFIVVGTLFSRQISSGAVKPLFSPTATPTRTFRSYENEGKTYFEIGKLDCLDQTKPEECAIAAFRKAIQTDPQNADLRAELAQLMVYSSATLTTSQEKLTRLQEAQTLATEAIEINPDHSGAYAVRALVRNWLSAVQVSKEQVSDEQRQRWLLESSQDATTALTKDENNIAALAYLAETQVDQQKWTQAEQTIQQALQRENPEEPVMDVHRVYGYVLENLGRYNDSITEYKKAAEITPNLTFLYINIGNKYRFLGDRGQNKALINEALDWFARAARINEQLGIRDPIPYLAIANTYANQGDFFGAVFNVRKAIELNPTTPQVYAQLGLVYHRSRNYEGSIPAFQCGLEGCDQALSCEVRQCDPSRDVMTDIPGLPLDDSTVIYYYTYGSVLAALHKDSRPSCDRAMDVLAMVREKYSDQPDIMSIVEASEDICASVAGDGTTETVTPEAATPPAEPAGDNPTGQPGGGPGQ